MAGPIRAREAARRHVARGARRGTVYLLVLAVTTIVTAIGLGAMLSQRAHTDAASRARDTADARAAASSAIELAAWMIDLDPNWRHNFGEGTWFASLDVGRARASLEAVAADGNTWDPDDREQPIELTATATAGEATQHLRVVIEGVRLPPEPIDALRKGALAQNRLSVEGGKELASPDAPVASNDLMVNNGIIDADIETDSYSGVGVVTGAVQMPTPDESMPGIDDLSAYTDRGTELSGVVDISGAVLSPATNPYGSANAEGIYVVRAGSSDVVISESRIVGTLIVLAPGRKVTIKDAALLQPAAGGMPTLIVDGDLVIDLESEGSGPGGSGEEGEDGGSAGSLDEGDANTNFNPPGTPYEGSSDNDRNDVYPSVVRGLVHATGTITFKKTARVEGVVLAGDAIDFENEHELLHEPELLADPPAGYRKPPAYESRLVPDSVERVLSSRTP